MKHSFRMSKDENRQKLASLSFAEKLKILDRLRRRSAAIAASDLREKRATKMKDRRGLGTSRTYDRAALPARNSGLTPRLEVRNE